MMRKKLMAWILAGVMAFGSIAGNGMTVFADSPETTVVQELAEETVSESVEEESETPLEAEVQDIEIVEAEETDALAEDDTEVTAEEIAESGEEIPDVEAELSDDLEIVQAEDELTVWTKGVTDEAEVAAKKAIWMDATKSVDERVSALLSVMTLDEKAAQMVQPEQNSTATPEIMKQYDFGSVLSGGGSQPPTGNSAADWENRVNEFKAAALESRLGIPVIYGVDAVHGHNNVDDTVIFPHNIAYAAAGDVNLARLSGKIAAEEIRATGIQWTFAPTLGVPYNEKWGRFYECFGEDKDLVAQIGAAFVEGFQGTTTMDGVAAQHQSISNTSVAATAKHYVGEGQTRDGVNQGNVDMTEEEFEALLVEKDLLKPYETAIAAGAKTLMASFNSIGGVKCHGNKRLLTDILKGERTTENPLGLNFQGFVVSDYSGHAQIEENTYKNYMKNGQTDVYVAKVAAAIDAGVDMFMEPYDWQLFINATKANVEKGIITPERIDDAVTRILRVKFEMGLFEETVASQTEKDLLSAVGSEEHRNVARAAVEESMVVLKNDKVGDTGKTALEILEEASSIRVAGYKANDIGAQCGGWTISWQGMYDSANGSGGKKVTTGTTIYEGFQNVARNITRDLTVTYSGKGKITGQDAAVVVVSEPPYAEYAGDRTAEDLVLEDDDLTVIQNAIDSKGDTALILVLMTGRPIAIADFVDDFDAVVEAWLPGTEGATIADMLLDPAADFTGTLPVTWTWYPQDIDEKFTDASKVLFPYGTGLKKDGSSIKEGGQTSIPENRPDAPEAGGAAAAIMYKNGVDVDAYNGKLEAEFCMPTSGDFSSYNISLGKESVDGASVGYVLYEKKDWANAKWKVYFRQAGTYRITARMQVSEGNRMVLGLGQNFSADNLGKEIYTDISATASYQDFVIGEYEIPSVGVYGIKLMDITDADWSTSHVKAKLDYLMLDCIEAVGEKDTGVEEEDTDDPTTEKPLDSKGNIIADGAVDVYMTSTEATQDWSWYKYPTEMANQLAKKEALDITSIDDQELTTIMVNPDKEYQEVLGFGTSLEESTVNNILKLTPDMQDEFLRMLVDPDQAGMTLFRITIGTSDFTSKPFYTYYDAVELTEENALMVDGELVPDWNNETGHGFSIQKDIDYGIVDVVKKVIELAKEYGVEDEVKFFASSWTPPGWTKNPTAASKSYKSYNNNESLIMGGALKDECIDDVAMYYTRYLEEYAKLGIDIYAITLQNEPMLEIEYPSCNMTGEQEGKLAIAIKKAVAASTVLNSEQKKVKLWAFDHNPSDAYSYVQSIFSVEGASEAIDGIAFHDYSGDLSLMQKVLDELLNKNGVSGQTVNLTERAVWGTEGANCIITYLRNSAISYNSWVTMLDSNIGVHQWVGEPAPPLFSRDAVADDDFWPMPEYYIIGQFSKFIRPGYVRVDSTLGSLDTVTNLVCKNPQTGELVAVVVNDTQKKQDFKVICEGTQFIGVVPADSVATFVWNTPENVHEHPENAFSAAEYAVASAGVSSGTDENGAYVQTAADSDYIDYIVDLEEAGTYGIILNQQPSADDQIISVYQGDTLGCRVMATKTWNTAKVDVRGAVTFANEGVQQIRIKLPAGVKLYSVKLVKMPDIHVLPGKILADEYINIVDDEARVKGATVNDRHQTGDCGDWTSFRYKVMVPEDGTYKLTLSSATTAGNEGEVRGFYVVVDDLNAEIGGYEKAAICNVDWGQAASYVPSGAWDVFNENSIDIDLTKGEHILAIKVSSPTNLAWFTVGSSVEVTAPEIKEGEEDGKSIQFVVAGGQIATDKDVIVEGLPEGVAFAANATDSTHMTVSLTGTRKVDFDSNVKVTVKIPVKQPDDKVLYNETDFTITAVKDAEELVKPEAVDAVALNATVTVPLKITGGTFNKKAETDIGLSGTALQYYAVNKVEVVDDETVQITLKYTEKIYRASELLVEVPVSAYDDSKSNAALTTSVSFNAEASLPQAIEPDANGVITLTESKAFATNGSLATKAAEGVYLDYFIDVPETAGYTVEYTIKAEGNGKSYSGAWNLNRGVPGTLGTNSYKGVNIPGLWTTDAVIIRQYVDLVEGKQTFEIASGSEGYALTNIRILPIKAQMISSEKATVIGANTYIGGNEPAIVVGNNVEYTAAGTTLEYAIDVEKAGTYSIIASYGIESSTNVKMTFTRVEDEETTLGTMAIPSTGAWSTYKSSDALKVELPAGKSTLRLTYVGNAANLQSLTFTPVEIKDEPIENPFGDVPEGKWYHDYVLYAYKNKLANGVGKMNDGSELLMFAPENTITRSMFVRLLYNKEGEPEVTYTGRFTDIPDGEWYSKAVEWAAANELVNGKAAGWFDGEGLITRQEMATILYRYAKLKGYDVTKSANKDLSMFADSTEVADWAVEPMKWASGYGVISGVGQNDGTVTMASYKNANRAEAVAVIVKFINAYHEK